MSRFGLAAWWFGRPALTQAPAPPKPEWERIAEEIIDARRPVGLDALVFGCWPGTYHPRPGDCMETAR